MAKPLENEDERREFEFTDGDFKFLAKLVGEKTGIVLAENKRNMIYSRLARRLRALDLHSFKQYCDVITNVSNEEEMMNFVNAVTTNLTSFFRESHHFEHLGKYVSEYSRTAKEKKLRIWSAGCSVGMEAYSIAMTLSESIPGIKNWDIKILATDIDTNMLDTGSKGIYSNEQLKNIPAALQKKYLEELGNSQFEVIEKLRNMVFFKRLNLMENWPVKGPFDLIFCRNTVIYFDKPTQKIVFEKFSELIKNHGFLDIGHRENYLSKNMNEESKTENDGRRKIPIRRTDIEKVQVGDFYDGVERYFDHVSETVVVKLMSGDCYVTSEKGEMIMTILGSCVAACVRDPVAGVGGMNHFLLPGDFDGRSDESSRYGTFAMEKLINEIIKLGGRKDRLEVKVFGGANVLENTNTLIGSKNVNFIRNFLKADGFKIESEHLGGTHPRRVHFYPDNGKVMMRQLRRKEDVKVIEKEETFRSSLRKKPMEGDIELF